MSRHTQPPTSPHLIKLISKALGDPLPPRAPRAVTAAIAHTITKPKPAADTRAAVPYACVAIPAAAAPRSFHR